MIAKGGSVTYHKLSPVDDDHARLRLVLATTSSELHEVSVPIAVPARFVVTGLSLSMPGEDPVLAVVRTKTEARQQYDDVVAQIRDPAILERIDDSHVMLRVFPVSRDAAATITLELTAYDTNLTYVSQTASLLAVPAMFDAVDIDAAKYWPKHHDSIGTTIPIPTF